MSDLIAFKTVSGEDNNSLINYCDEILIKLGATSFKTFDDEKKRVNLFATIKSKKPNGKNQLYCQDIQMLFLFRKAGPQTLLKQQLRVTNFLDEALVI